MNAPTNNKKDIEKGQSEESETVKPVVVIIETVWKAISLILLALISFDDALIIIARINIRVITARKNRNSGSYKYLRGFFLFETINILVIGIFGKKLILSLII